MTYKHLSIDELTMIESYYLQHNKPVEIANRMGRAIQTIYNVVNKFKQGKTALDYWHQYKENKKKCDRKVIQLPAPWESIHSSDAPNIRWVLLSTIAFNTPRVSFITLARGIAATGNVTT